LLRFERANFDALENGGAATITVIRTGGAAGPLTVDYAAADGTALAGLDYTVVRGTLTFADGVRTQPFVVPLLDDGSAECNETVRLSLFNATGGGGATVLCPGTNATLTIVDGDGAHRGEVLLVSANTNSAPASGDGASGRPSISASGRFVAFQSLADDLTTGHPEVNPDVFVRDLASGTTRRLSVDLALSGAFNPVLSGHGSNVVFNGEFEPGGGALYVHRGEFGTNQAVSVRPDGGLSWASGFGASISSNGLVIAFVSDGDDLAPPPVNNANHDVFVRDLATQTTTLVSINAAGTGEGNDASFGARVSADGRYVVFLSYASDLVTNDTGGGADVFLRDLQAGVTTLVSRNRQGTRSGDAESTDAVISADGRYVAFTSYASDLVAGDTNLARDVFLFDRIAGTTTLISANRFGTGSGNDESFAPSISTDGRRVAFESRAHDLVPNDVNGRLADVFVRDVITGATTLVSLDCAGTRSGNDQSFAPRIAGDGLSVVFSSQASDLTSGEFGGGVHPQLFRRDLTTGRTELISRNLAQTGGANHDCFEPAISFQGAVIAFASHASDLALNDANDSEDVFAWNAGAAPAPIPPLALHRQGDNEVVLSWPAPSTGYRLEAADNLNPASVWTPVNTLVSENGLRKSVILMLDTNRTARFFRLRK
jgi:Tol biopolymer transport system component